MFPKNFSVGITGSRGRLASVLAAHLRQRGVAVRAYSRTPDSENLELSQLPKDLQTGMVNVVIHLAWSVVPAEAEKNPEIQWREDLPLLRNLLEQIARKKNSSPENNHFIFFSSGSVYGEQDLPGQLFAEGDRLKPKGLYARAKEAAESMILDQGKKSLRAAILRITNPYGFLQKSGRPQGVIPALCYAAKQQKPFTVWGDGAAIKDYLYMEDLCTGVEAVIRGQLEGIYNIASGEPVALLDLIEKFRKITNLPLEVHQAPAKSWDVQHAGYSAQKLRTATGWTPTVFLDEGLQKFWSDWNQMKLPHD